jgi:hypothetical protein
VRVALALILAMAPSAASARDLFEEGEYRLTLRTAFKSSLLLAFPADDPVMVEEIGGLGNFRLRAELGATLTDYFSAQIAYEHRVFATSSSGIGAGLLAPNLAPPFRLAPLDWAIVDEAPSYTHRHEIDRAYASLHLPFLELTVGRQAIGLGRGVLFSAIDLFAPFAPAEIDREWRRGVDAVHAELRIPEVPGLSADYIAVLGNVESGELESWSMLGRIRAVVGDVDAEIIMGHRAGDNIAGAAMSGTIFDAELHGEFALFGTDGRGIDGGFAGTRSIVAKAVLGGSYVIDFWRGIRVVLEYHYSGFGVENIGGAPDILFDPIFQSRLLRGDTQILGRHALALSLSSDLFDDLSGAVSYIQSPTDGSGMISTALTWTQSDVLTIVANAVVPWGTPPNAGLPRSEWGSQPITILLQARVYD